MGWIDKTGAYYEGDMAAGDRAATPAEQAARDAVVAALMAQQVADNQARIDAKADSVVQTLRYMTPAQAEAYVHAQVIDLASARSLLKKFAVVLCVLVRRL